MTAVYLFHLFYSRAVQPKLRIWSTARSAKNYTTLENVRMFSGQHYNKQRYIVSIRIFHLPLLGTLVMKQSKR